MFKIIMLLKKRADITREEFIEHYDNVHVPFMHGLVPQGAAVHRRNFVVPKRAADAGAETDPGSECDAIVEVFYEDLDTAERAMRCLTDPQVRSLMEQDESKFIHPGSIRRYVVEVHETVFRPLPAKEGLS
jgi:EthD domain-containing protein